MLTKPHSAEGVFNLLASYEETREIDLRARRSLARVPHLESVLEAIEDAVDEARGRCISL